MRGEPFGDKIRVKNFHERTRRVRVFRGRQFVFDENGASSEAPFFMKIPVVSRRLSVLPTPSGGKILI
jgi:hypothetical protein